MQSPFVRLWLAVLPVAPVLLLGLTLLGCSGADSRTNVGEATASATAVASATPTPSGSASAEASTSAAPSASGSEAAVAVKELPKGSLPTETESQKMWKEVVELAGKSAKFPCKAAISPRTRFAFTSSRPDAASIKSQMVAYLRLARCAEALLSYGFLMELGQAMYKADPAGGHPEVVARAYLGKRDPERALQVLADASKSSSEDGNVAMTYAKVYCAMAKWADCSSSASSAVTLSAKEQDADEQRRLQAGANKYLARAYLHQGKLDDASAKLDEAEKKQGKKADIDDIRGEIAMARAHGTIVDIDAGGEVLLGTYHLIGKVKDLAPLVRIRLENVEDAENQYRVQVEIQGTTQESTQTVVLKGKAATSLQVNPALRADYDIDRIRAPEQTGVSVKITKLKKGGDDVVVQQSVNTTLQPRDYLPLGSYDQEQSRFKKDRRFVAAWVTPNDKAIDDFLKEAKKKLNKGESFSGEQAATVPQVKALFEALRARGVSYVMDPEALSADLPSQRTRLPSEVLASTNAQCLEGSILYATLFEAIGLKPVTIHVPGHAFVAWKPGPKDKTQEKLFFLETTLTGVASVPFERAMEAGAKKFAEQNAKNGALVNDIGLLRKDGITPQPSTHLKR